MTDLAPWVILMTEPGVDPGRARVGVLDRSGGFDLRLSAAWTFDTRELAQAEVDRLREAGRTCNGYVLTIAPLGSPAVPPLPGKE